MSTIPIVATVRRVITEDLGKAAEYALCLLLGTPFGGTYKYSQEEAERLKARFAGAAGILAGYRHTGKESKLYDFQGDGPEARLSVKTTKDNSWKICPQILGQPTRKKFCEAVGLPVDSDNQAIKAYIEANLPQLLERYTEHTFHCPVLFYDKASDTCLYIRLVSGASFGWAEKILQMSHLVAGKPWGESSTVYCSDTPESKKTIGESVSQSETAHTSRPLRATLGESAPRSNLVPAKQVLGEFQIHNHRSCVKFRFNLRTMLETFPDCFEVQKL